MKFNRSSRVLSAIAAMLATAPATGRPEDALPHNVPLTARAWRFIRSTIRKARGKTYGKHADPAEFQLGSPEHQIVQAAADKRARRALDVHGMRS